MQQTKRKKFISTIPKEKNDEGYIFIYNLFSSGLSNSRPRAKGRSNLKEHAILKIISQEERIFTAIEIDNILGNQDISVRGIRSKGFQKLYFFTLEFPKMGIPISGGGDIITAYTPDLTREIPIFAHDILNNVTYALDEGYLNDILAFYYLAQHRTTVVCKKFYSKRVWQENLFIEEISVSRIYELCEKLKKLKHPRYKIRLP
ncbi:MAG: hypothetical protein AAFV95_27315 [Bacteroidota bacterium]